MILNSLLIVAQPPPGCPKIIQESRDIAILRPYSILNNFVSDFVSYLLS